jgi:hypothetical protein
MTQASVFLKLNKATTLAYFIVAALAMQTGELLIFSLAQPKKISRTNTLAYFVAASLAKKIAR